jgi:hypothetical protein
VDLIEVEAMAVLFKDLKQATYLARAIASGAKGNSNVSVEEVISVHALINAYYQNGYNALVQQGHILLKAPEPDPTPTQPPPGSN